MMESSSIVIQLEKCQIKIKIKTETKTETKNKFKTTALLATLDCEPQTKTFIGKDKVKLQKSILSGLNKICLFTFTSIYYIFKRECFSDI
jgi:hypothetical protein